MFPYEVVGRHTSTLRELDNAWIQWTKAVYQHRPVELLEKISDANVLN